MLGSRTLDLSVGLGLLIACAAMLWPGAAHAEREPDLNTQASARLSGHVKYVRAPSAHAGVKLLEDILGRVRSVPQVAMVKRNLRPQNQELAGQTLSGPTNYQLAIRPPAKSKSIWEKAGDAESADASDRRRSEGPAWGGGLAPGAFYSGSAAPRSGVWEAEGQGGLPLSGSREPLRVAAGKIYSLARKLEAANEMTTAGAPVPRAVFGNAAPRVAWHGAPRAQPPVVASGLPEPVSADQANRAAPVRQEQVALLPPNVFTGIPMVRLGVSEVEAGRALATVGSMERQRINGWTVWTLNRGRISEPALQVYVRYGRVEALRIFDPSLLGSDFGVKLADSLATVKERFGEPAFIVPEPGSRAGQNYVYPISQVAFLISRPTPAKMPEARGMLIFNVK